MILATRSGWLIAVTVIETSDDQTVVTPNDEPAAKWAIAHDDPDEKLFDSVDDAGLWILAGGGE